jgi:hypothetical protein
MPKVKFATKLDTDVLRELRLYSEESKVSIADVVTAAVASHLENVRVRPAFRKAVDNVIAQNHALLKSLAK